MLTLAAGAELAVPVLRHCKRLTFSATFKRKQQHTKRRDETGPRRAGILGVGFGPQPTRRARSQTTMLAHKGCPESTARPACRAHLPFKPGVPRNATIIFTWHNEPERICGYS